MKPVLILDANQRSALAVTRSLGRKSVTVITADETPASLAGSSRYSRSYVQHPSALHDSQAFIDSVINICTTQNIALIMPMTELTTELLLKHLAILPEVILPFPDSKTINTLSDKCQLMNLAESLQVPIPKTWYRSPSNGADIDLGELHYPLVIKPGKSWLETCDGWIHTAVRFAGDTASAADIIKHDPAFHSQPYMLQDCVDGHGEGIFALYNRGHAVAFFAHKRLREKPPRGGVSVLSESTAVNPDLQGYAEKLLDHVNWHGIAMVEFKVDDDGTAHLMEINTRFWGSLQLSVDAGVDFPCLLYQVACGEQIVPVTSYQTGKRLRWILGDLDSLFLTLRDKEFSFMDKTRAVLQFLLPRPFKTRHEVNRLSDFKPFLWELKQYIKDLKNS